MGFFAACAPGLAAAQTVGVDTSIDAQTLWPAGGPTEHLALRGTTVSPSGGVGFSLFAHFMRQPLVLTPNATGVRTPVVDYAATTDFLFSVGILDRFQVSLGIPVVVAQSGQGALPVNAPGATQLGDTALRDLRFELSWAIVQRARRADASGIGLRLDLGGAAPIGDDRGFNSSGTFTFAPMLAFDWRNKYVTATANVGARIRGTSAIGDLAVGSVGVVGVGLAVRPAPSARFGLSVDYVNILPLVSREGMTTTTTQELFLGARYATDQARDIEVFAGGAVPLTDAPLTPSYRVIAGVSYAPRGHDTDGDRVVDADDRCPTQPEDRDEFQDDDGCPDPDNDGDGVLDVNDRCRDEAEDADNHDDADGCPDPDNDGDGVEDVDDQCPDQPAGDHADPEREGCPIPDTDADGVLDPDDRCVDVAQGPHPDPARAGCPMPDRDNDGVGDADDRCPAEAAGEHPDRWRRGCPDDDLDRDGVRGADDRCPEQPETINGVTDDDGCPDTGAEVVTWEPDGTTLRIARPFTIARGAQVLTPAARALVAQVAQLRARGGEVARASSSRRGPRSAPPVRSRPRGGGRGDALIGLRIPQRIDLPGRRATRAARARAGQAHRERAHHDRDRARARGPRDARSPRGAAIARRARDPATPTPDKLTPVEATLPRRGAFALSSRPALMQNLLPLAEGRRAADRRGHRRRGALAHALSSGRLRARAGALYALFNDATGPVPLARTTAASPWAIESIRLQNGRAR
ncbi:MAG: hypothetical protein R3A52_11975 [Polyangiales bacterium]